MARIIDFTRQRYGTFRRGQTEDKRRINEQLRQVSQSYLRPEIAIPVATSAVGGAMDIGKGLMQRAARSKAQASMLQSAQSRLAAQPRVLDKSDPTGLAREFVDPIAAARAQRQIQDIQGIQQQGLAYLQSQATMANTEERQRELLSLASLTQGPQYQGRSLAQIAAGQTLPDVGQIGTQQKLMASLFPQTQAELEAQRLKTRETVAGVEKAEAEVEGMRSENAVKALDAAVAGFKQLALKDPKLAPYVSGLEKILADVGNVKSQTERRRAQTAGEEAERVRKGREASLKHQEFLARLRQDLQIHQENLAEKREARIAKSRKGPRRKGDSTPFRGTIKIKPEGYNTIGFFNQRLVDPLYKEFNSEAYRQMSEAKKLDFAVKVVNALGLQGELKGMKAADPGWNSAVSGIATRAMIDIANNKIGAQEVLTGPGITLASGENTESVAGKILNAANQAMNLASAEVERLTAMGKVSPDKQATARTQAKDNLDFAQELQSQISRIKNNDYKALRDIAVILSSGLGQKLLGKTGAVDLYNSLGIQELSVD